jgi:hypothetical protein
VRIAILITAYNLPTQLDLLVHRLCPAFDVFLHADKRFTYRTNHPRLFRTDVRYRSHWGSYGQILATLELFKAAHEKGHYDRYVLISGQDLPCVSNDEISAFFSLHPATEFIEGWDANVDKWNQNGSDRVKLFWFNYNKNLSKKNVLHVLPRLKRRMAHILELGVHGFQRTFGLFRNFELPMYVGSNWMDLTEECVDYIFRYLENNPKYLPRFKHTRCAVEVFFQTIVFNSHFCERRAKQINRYFTSGSGPERPSILRCGDEESILSSGALFARKFDERVDSRIIANIYAHTENSRIPRQ